MLKLSKSSLPALEDALKQAIERLGYFQGQRHNEETRLQRPIGDEITRLTGEIKKLEAAAANAYREVERLSKMEVPSGGVLGTIFGFKALPKNVEQEVIRQRFLTNESNAAAASLRQQLSRLAGVQGAVERQANWIAKIETALARRKRKKDKESELKAAAALNVHQTRRVAASVRKQLEKQPHCPYCGGSIGDTPHADHIYPVAKGGRSVPRNMVWVCADCNLKKRDLTLTGFVRKFEYDRVAIEARLDGLGKDY